MEEKSWPQDVILHELTARLADDFTYDSGRIIGSMCTRPHLLAREVYNQFLEVNLGDSGLVPAVARLESETIQMLGALLSNPKASGNIVTGGTEANILALWAAKKLSKKKHGEIIIPDSAHCSFDKAADLLDLKIVKIGLNKMFQVNVEAVEKAINPKTTAIVGIAGTTCSGSVDPISELSKIALEENIYLHVDAAFGGFVLPFLKQLEFDVSDFDFSLPGVCSITIDPHKMGLAPTPAGGILFRNEELRRTVTWKVSYLSGGKTEQATLAGTRSGASVIAVWALMKHLGREGYKRIVRRCMQLTQKLSGELRKIDGLDTVMDPVMNIVGIRSESQALDIRRIAEELRLRGWAVSLFPDHIRLVVMPHVQEQHIEEFLKDLKSIVKEEGG